MSRTERLLELLQTLRRHRLPVSGHRLAAEMGISLRTLYRDIATLQCQGAEIEGEPGVGYVLRPGFMLPPLMFSTEEIEALVLGTRWVAGRSDERLGLAARNALAKIGAVLPQELRDELDAIPLLVAPSASAVIDRVDVALIRQAIRNERKLEIQYRDDKGSDSARVIWPFALGFFDSVRLVMAWCELRQDFRHFRTDRIAALTAGDRYPRRRHALLKEWRGIHQEPKKA
ncbi:putative DNA-binding transcriptional regulator YafY [Achromobacter deleyi]|jgi:predicted DNA-binding transcriptional regulator YafY|uniref:helix-turn-helix transcriptional regulator n=1 Tax=Achromobacter TaxID=222 RepID=UPI000CFC8FC3|nr:MULTISPECIES: YafY family protein [Achromobacter]MDR6601518.1 putative DNA-binding transcriptional regulator YafY [Achromobacter deleyi]PQZ64744.1 transcriptional regulator [Achromobacter sp. MYb9]